MNIIIEGVDCTFKSTIAKKLSSKFDIPVVRGSSFELATGTNTELFNFNLELARLENTIIERFIYSNYVYATLYPKHTILTHEQRKNIEDLMRNKSIIVYLTASPDVIIKRLEQRGDEYVTTDKVSDIIKMYNVAISEALKNGMKVYTYDTGILSSDDVVSQISESLYTLNFTPNIKCKNCKKTIKRKNSYFNETHCFNCYLKTAEELLSNKNE